ncbi:CYTH-like_domain-containing protein [Hexamita inflata]|uniref:CYTH-like domain-containing protein n=1 Tax=Hexamita inflata TaxID=28002 RepID=A0AA86UHJ7_9EUKA|nr:CYTH-like domain-containing protein [Hexamita inflata]
MEQELKVSIRNQLDFDKLLAALAVQSTETQINTYLSNAHLQQNKIVARVRSCNNELKLHIKTDAHSENGYFITNTKSVPLTEKTVEEFIQNQKIGPEFNNLQVTIAMKTTRFNAEYKGLELECDKVEFNGLEFFEIECETLDAEKGKKTIEALLQEIGIQFEYATCSKLTRAQQMLKK